MVNSQDPTPEATHPDIQEILRKRREMLNRVKADLERVGKLQEDFRQGVQKPPNSSDLGK
jgi:hypothetical protein